MKEKIGKWIRHNQGVFVAALVAGGILVWCGGCESKVTSMLDQSRMVTAEELNLELVSESRRLEGRLDNLLSLAVLKKKELERKDEIKKKLLNFAAITVDAGTVNPAGVVGMVFSVLGVGALVDNRLKDKVIKNRPLK